MISIIIPTLNEEKIIRQTINCFKRLTLPHEIIVSDAGSKDATVAIAKELGVKVLVHTASYRQTIAEGRTVGGMTAQGELLAFFDADCSVTNPDQFFADVLSYFEQNPEVLAIAPTIKVLPDKATFTDKVITFLINVTYRFFNNILKKGAAPGECQIVRKTAFEAVGGYNKALITGEDVDFFSRLGKIGTVRFIAALTVWHTGRRAHKLGWPRLLFTWFINTIAMMFRGKSVSSEWKPIR